MPTLAQALQGAGPRVAGPTVRLYVGPVTAVTATTMTVAAAATVTARIVRTGAAPVVGQQALVLEQQGVGRFGFTLA